MMTLEQAQRFMDFLTGDNPPDGITLARRPRKMPQDQAFSLIYVLQEAFHVIPDVFELCSLCGHIYDTESEGHHPEGSNRFYCGGCEYQCRCKECKAAR